MKKSIKILIVVLSLILVGVIVAKIVVPFVIFESYMKTIEKMEVNFLEIPEITLTDNMQKIETDLYTFYIDKELEYDEEISYEDEFTYRNNEKSVQYYNYVNENINFNEYDSEKLKSFNNSVDKYIAIAEFNRENYSFLNKEDLLFCSILILDAMDYMEDTKIYVGQNENIKFLIRNFYTTKNICAINIVNNVDGCEYSLTIAGYSVDECVEIISTIEFK